MEFVKSKCLQECKGKKRGKYLITLEVTDYDIEMFGGLSGVYCTKSEKPECEFKPKYNKWLKKAYSVFWKLWKKYDNDE